MVDLQMASAFSHMLNVHNLAENLFNTEQLVRTSLSSTPPQSGAAIVTSQIHLCTFRAVLLRICDFALCHTPCPSGE
jgi:hypothetical protein